MYMVYPETREDENLNGQNMTSLINENIIYVIAVGEQTTEIALTQKQINLKLASYVKGQINYLIDLNKCGKNSSEARQIWKESAEDERTDKVAIFGLNPVAKVIASFVMGVTRKKNQRFFNTEAEALLWITQPAAYALTETIKENVTGHE